MIEWCPCSPPPKFICKNLTLRTSKCDLTQKQGCHWCHEGGSQSSMTGVLTKRWNSDTETCTVGRRCEDAWREDKPSTSQGERREQILPSQASERKNPVGSQILDFKPPSLSLKTPWSVVLWYSALEDSISAFYVPAVRSSQHIPCISPATYSSSCRCDSKTHFPQMGKLRHRAVMQRTHIPLSVRTKIQTDLLFLLQSTRV